MGKEKATPELLESIRQKNQKKGNWIKVGMSSCGIAAGAEEVFKTLIEEAKSRNISIEVRKCGCIGMCYAEPLVEVYVEGTPLVLYGGVDKDAAIKIIEKHVAGKMLVNDYIFVI